MMPIAAGRPAHQVDPFSKLSDSFSRYHQALGREGRGSARRDALSRAGRPIARVHPASLILSPRLALALPGLRLKACTGPRAIPLQPAGRVFYEFMAVTLAGMPTAPHPENPPSGSSRHQGPLKPSNLDRGSAHSRPNSHGFLW